MNKINDATTLVSISAAERETGISKDTLRIWERRYGFPLPTRDLNGDRAYTIEDVERLRIIKRLMDHGVRPGKIVGQSLIHLNRISSKHSAGPIVRPEFQTDVETTIALIKSNQLIELQKVLHQGLLRVGLFSFITEILKPINVYLGESWISGEISIFQEHAYTEILQNILRHAIVSYEKGIRPPKVLLATLPKEQHSIGLLMVEAVLTVEGVHCVSLGPQMPVAEIVAAATAHQVNIVALSFTGHYPVKHISEGLSNLRHELPQNVEIWAGGKAISQFRRNADEIKLLPTLGDALKEVWLWRERHLESI